MAEQQVTLYAISTCSHCRAVKALLDELNADFEVIDVDLLDPSERKTVLEQVKQYNARVSFPTTIIGDKVIVGDKIDQIKEALKSVTA